MATTIYLFYSDMAFVNQYNVGHTIGEVAGIGKLNQRGASYFMNLHVEVGPKDVSNRLIDWIGETQPKILVDEYWYPEFTKDISNSSEETKKAVFDILDYIFFKSNADKEGFLTTSTRTKDVYIPNSLIKEKGNSVTDNYYLGSDITKINTITTNSYRIFQIGIPVGQEIKTYQIIAYCDGNTFNSRYPNSKILSVSPPMTYKDLLFMDFINDTGNKFGVATTAADILGINIELGNKPTDVPTASLLFSIDVHDEMENIAYTRFTILYKGNVPTDTQIRTALRDAVLNSGYGTEDQWRKRLPSLFVNYLFYIVPFWDNTVMLPDSVVFSGSLNSSIAYDRIRNILPNVDLSIMTDQMDYVISGYNRIFLAAVPDAIDPRDIVNVKPFHEVLPEYFGYSSTESNFNYMSTDAQSFTKQLTNVLVYLNEGRNPVGYNVTTTRTLEYVSFVVNDISYCVITPDCYHNALKG